MLIKEEFNRKVVMFNCLLVLTMCYSLVASKNKK